MASVVQGAGQGAAAGSVAGPWGAAVGGVLGAAGTLWANSEEQDAAEKAKAAYAEQANKGINTLQGGRMENTANQTPFIQAGQAGAAGTLSSIQNRQQAEQPTQSNVTPSGVVSDYLNPSAAYTTRIANDAITAKALAGGSAGGGMLKALSDNANKMAMTNYNTAYQQALDTGTQNFNQGQQIYSNKTAYDQSQIGNYQNLMNTGENAASNLGTTNLGYDNSLNQSFQALGNSNAGGDYLKGQSNAATAQQTGNIVGSTAQNVIGSYMAQGNSEDEE